MQHGIEQVGTADFPVNREVQILRDRPNSTKHSEAVSSGDASRTGPERRRYLPLDAYRGLIMLMLVSGGFGLYQLPDQPFFNALTRQLQHSRWNGLTLWDLIMPAFLFMVGVAMPFSLHQKTQRGESARQIFRDVALRSLGLILLSQVIVSVNLGRPHIQFHHVLTQVAITYFLCFFIMKALWWQQALIALLLLTVDSAIYLIFPGPNGAFAQVTNAGARIDRMIMGFNYAWPCVNINFLTETANVIFGVWTGQLLRSERPRTQQLRILALSAATALVLGLLLSPVIPINKWLWTASYAIYTTGWVLFGMLAMILLTEYAGIRKPVFPLLVVGMNPLFVYAVINLFSVRIDEDLRVFTNGFKAIGTFGPIAQELAIVLVVWLMALWLYQRKVFIKM